MWIFGAMSKQELAQATAQGWDVERELTQDEVDKFVSPNNGKVTQVPTDKIFVLLYINSNVSETLNDWVKDKADEIPF